MEVATAGARASVEASECFLDITQFGVDGSKPLTQHRETSSPQT
jgi:hypothetical protein